MQTYKNKLRLGVALRENRQIFIFLQHRTVKRAVFLMDALRA